MNKCDCYCTEEKIIGWHTPVDPKTTIVHKCNGTRERDECSCGGDRTKCDFYPKVREKALPKFGEWISVADRLPNQHLDDEGIELSFIVWGKDYIHSQTAYFNGKIFYFRCYDGTEGIMNGITHWMPLPTPPIEKEN